ncbi:helix-turn-helix domain-containing protein [Halobacillus sp. A5]|uniref:helix-turn-helix domain-containing protein n=1 Tax=Halobacillus sp. A5 TaxID=2880263 RepID=UPI0020A6CE4B|nr:helix-turn-helix domain-containing protein [Halobacillus sp. A5]MCP3025392.1 helix-turn-helix domain-containing protein [Halobacillus sp. A5]
MLTNGNVSNYKHLSKFTSTEELNLSIRGFLYKFKYELNETIISIYRLIANHAVKFTGICFMKYSTIAKQINKSESTVKRSLKVLKDLKALEVHRTTRTSGRVRGGFGHNVFVLCDMSNELSKMNHRQNDEKLCEVQSEHFKNSEETSPAESGNLLDKRSSNNVGNKGQLNHTYLPDTIPNEFVEVVKPFFNNASDIYTLWLRVQNVCKSVKLKQSSETYVNIAIQVFKGAVFMQKNNKIRTSFIQYFYGGLKARLLKQASKEKYNGHGLLQYDWIGEEA